MNNIENYLSHLKVGIEKLDLLKLQVIEDIILKKIIPKFKLGMKDIL